MKKTEAKKWVHNVTLKIGTTPEQQKAIERVLKGRKITFTKQ
jgi:hypothetical protein